MPDCIHVLPWHCDSEWQNRHDSLCLRIVPVKDFARGAVGIPGNCTMFAQTKQHLRYFNDFAHHSKLGQKRPVGGNGAIRPGAPKKRGTNHAILRMAVQSPPNYAHQALMGSWGSSPDPIPVWTVRRKGRRVLIDKL